MDAGSASTTGKSSAHFFTWIVIAAAAAVSFGLSPSCRSTAPGERQLGAANAARLVETPNIRVRLASKQKSVSIDGEGDVIVTPLGKRAQAQVLQQPLEVGLSQSGFVVRDGAGVRRVFDRSTSLRIVGRANALVKINKARHDGALDLYPRLGARTTTFDVIEELPIELYLPGVLAKELYASWKLQAYEAQAIAARSYALHEMSRRRSLGAYFDIEGSVLDQAYAGATSNKTARKAVAKTVGLVMTSEGGVLRAYYSSTCGGRAASASDTWPVTPASEFNLAPPIQAHERDCTCTKSPYHRWEVRRPRSDLARRFAAFGKHHGLSVRKIRSVSTIRPMEWNEIGRPSAYRISDATGNTWKLSAEQLRTACNFHGAKGLSKPSSKMRVRSGDLEFETRGQEIVVRGRGFGHGVGLCQFGAQAMAKDGHTPVAILRHYYPEAQIERSY